MSTLVHPRQSFHGMPRIDHLPGRRDYAMHQTPDHWFGYLASDGTWLIPRDGVHTDQGSIPSIFFPIIPADAYWAFYIHDDLYQWGRVRKYRAGPDGLPHVHVVMDEILVTRDQADKWLHEAMCVENRRHKNGNWFEAWLIYRKVRRWGFMAWNSHDDGRIKSGFHLI